MNDGAVSEPLRIAVIGAGQIGSAFAFQLSLVGGHDVTVVARPGSARLAQLQRDKAIVTTNAERAPVNVLDALDEETAYDAIIVTLLDHQVANVLPSLRRSRARCIQFMFNTFRPERLTTAIGADRVSFGMQSIQAKLDSKGRLTRRIGGGGQKTLMARQDMVDVFAAAGIPAVLEPDMPLWLRCHAPLCVAFESVCIAGEQRGGGASWKEAMTLARGVKACFELIRKQGQPIYPTSKEVLGGSPHAAIAAMLWAPSRVRSFRELLATGGAECRALVNEMAQAATAIGRPDLAASIQAMEPRGIG